MKTFQTLFIILLFSVGLFAQDTVKFENALLWEISGNGLKQSSYIFGTIHMVPEDDFFFTEKMHEKFDECYVLALEIDINMSLIEQFRLAKKAILPDNKSLSDYMTADEYRLLSTYLLDSLKISQLTWNQMTKLKPLFSSSLILNDLIPKSKTFEVEFNKEAKKNKMTVIGLETADYQIDVLDKISLEDQVEMLKVEDYETDPLKEFMDLVKLHRSQDINEMLELFYQDSSMTDFEDELLIKRNSNWIPVIEKQIKENPVFIAVGAMHLPGEFGVLNLLTEKGYTLTPVKIFE